MEQFEFVPKYLVTRGQPAMEQNDFIGNWIRLEDYQKLLEAYKEIKNRLEGLEK